MTDPENFKRVFFDRPKLERLKVAYEEAAMAERETFNFEGLLLLTSYSQLMIQYLEREI